MKVNEMVTDLARAFNLGHSVLHCLPEASVCRQLCRGDITLEQARAIFLSPDWTKAYEDYFGLYENVLHLIPGEIIASAQHGFPPVDTCKG
jgi:hypothetical protein